MCRVSCTAILSLMNLSTGNSAQINRGTVENVEKFISLFSFHNLSTPVPVSKRIFCFVLHFHFLCTKRSPLVSLPYFVLQTSQKTLERLSVQTIRSFKSFLMSRSRSCEIISSLCFLHFGEFLGTASNKQEDLMMN